jgi:hypothetical protein
MFTVYIHTFFMVTFDTGTNFPAVRWNSLLAVAMMNIIHRWKGIAVPTQSHPNAASLTLCAWNIFTINVLRFCVPCSLRLNVPLIDRRGVMSDVGYLDSPQDTNFLALIESQYLSKVLYCTIFCVGIFPNIYDDLNPSFFSFVPACSVFVWRLSN